MDNDSELLHFCVSKALREYRELDKYAEKLRNLLLQAIFSVDNEVLRQKLLSDFQRLQKPNDKPS